MSGRSPQNPGSGASGLAMGDLPDPKYKAVDLNGLDHDGRYRFLTGSVVPRPIALVTSLGSNGILNAAPFSQFIIITYDPPMLGFVVHHGPNGLKDTLKNLRHPPACVINTLPQH